MNHVAGPRRPGVRLRLQEDPGSRQRVPQAAGRVPRMHQANGAWIPNYGKRHRCGEAISSAFVESTVN